MADVDLACFVVHSCNSPSHCQRVPFIFLKSLLVINWEFIFCFIIKNKKNSAKETDPQNAVCFNRATSWEHIRLGLSTESRYEKAYCHGFSSKILHLPIFDTLQVKRLNMCFEKLDYSLYTSYLFIRIPKIGLASVFLIFGQIKLKIILNFLQNLSLLFLISFVFNSFFFAKIPYSFTKLIWYS